MSSVAGTGCTFNVSSVGGTWSWTVLANNVQGLGQQYQVVDVMTPYGKFTDVVVPLPGDVVTAMADSISQLQEQLAPRVLLLSGTPSSYSATVTEGDTALSLATVPFVNAGAFGSFLTVTATPDSPWLTAAPPKVSGLGKNQSGQTSIGVLPALMLATASPYVGHVLLQDNNSDELPITVNVTVLPRSQIGVSAPAVSLSYAIQSGISGGAQQSIVSNAGPLGSVLNFTAAKIQNSSPWLAFTPSSDGPLASGDTSIITFSLVPANLPTIPGTYTETVAIASRTASNSPQNITVTLVVTA